MSSLLNIRFEGFIVLIPVLFVLACLNHGCLQLNVIYLLIPLCPHFLYRAIQLLRLLLELGHEVLVLIGTKCGTGHLIGKGTQRDSAERCPTEILVVDVLHEVYQIGIGSIDGAMEIRLNLSFAIYDLQFELSCDRLSLTIVCKYIHLFGLPLDYAMVASGYPFNPC